MAAFHFHAATCGNQQTNTNRTGYAQQRLTLSLPCVSTNGAIQKQLHRLCRKTKQLTK
jgi:hypothetical protein